MTASIVATVSLIVKPSAIDAFWRDALPKLQAWTRGFPGVRLVRALRRQTLGPSTIVMFINVFESRAVADAYFGWRQKTGAIEQLENLSEGMPEIEFWPLCSGDTWVDNELLIK